MFRPSKGHRSGRWILCLLIGILLVSVASCAGTPVSTAEDSLEQTAETKEEQAPASSRAEQSTDEGEDEFLLPIVTAEARPSSAVKPSRAPSSSSKKEGGEAPKETSSAPSSPSASKAPVSVAVTASRVPASSSEALPVKTTAPTVSSAVATTQPSLELPFVPFA